jgi:OOP family OmpA-OmpF porin
VRVTARRSGGRRLLPGLVLAGALAACAAPPAPAPPPAPVARPSPPAPPPSRADLVVLVPGPDGTVGTVVVQEGGREIVLDTAYESARSGAGGRLEAGQATPEEVRAIFADALTAAPPRPVSFVLHFVEGTDQITPASQALVDQILVVIDTRPAPDLTVAGHTDAVGTDQLNDALSLRRAERVRDFLIARGIAPDRIVAVGRGKRELLVPTPDGVAEARNRRVEITVR